MPIEITMPALSPTMTEGNLAKWLVKEGDAVEAGKVIAEIETDKATMEVEAVDEGIVGRLLVKQGAKAVKVNEVIAILLEKGESAKDVDAFLKQKAEESAKKQAKDSEAKKGNAGKGDSVAVPTAGVAVVEAKGFMPPPIVPITAKAGELNVRNASHTAVSASPLAKRLAKDAGIAVERLIGTGPGGRVVKEDVEQAIRTGTTMAKGGQVVREEDEQTLIENSNMRQVIAKRLLQSKQHVPHFYLNVDCNLDRLLEVRKELNARAPMIDGKPTYKISVNDLVIKAAALALNDVPAVNASWTDEYMVQYNNVDISVAVAVDEGLITPIVKNADQKSVQAISIEMKNLAHKAKAGTLAPEEFQGGGFSISNLGMYGITSFQAIVNPPQSSILAVGAGQERAIVVNGELEIATMMTVSLSCDHRVVDGAVGAQFLHAFKQYIEHPVWMLV